MAGVNNSFKPLERRRQDSALHPGSPPEWGNLNGGASAVQEPEVPTITGEAAYSVGNSIRSAATFGRSLIWM